MTQEEFRKWVVVIMAAFLVTVWIGMGLKLIKGNTMVGRSRMSAADMKRLIAPAKTGTLQNPRISRPAKAATEESK